MFWHEACLRYYFALGYTGRLAAKENKMNEQPKKYSMNDLEECHDNSEFKEDLICWRCNKHMGNHKSFWFFYDLYFCSEKCANTYN
jgi:hypothetical protein